LGFLWPVIVPLVMLAVYTFVFGYVFQARWQIGERSSSPTQYALILFAGLTAFNIFSETINRSTTLIVGMPNYVKKVVFPLEVYPLVVLANALTLSLINLLLLVVGNLVLAGSFSKTIFLLPLAYLPLIFLCLGLGWFLASLGVYIRDLAQAMPVITTLLFFLSPIVYQIEAVPERLRQILYLNPLTTIIDGFRQVLLLGGPLPWLSWGIWTGLTFILAVLGYAWFMGTKRGFSDVL
jgi:lipopolysaccharide transport system permease protein